MNKHSLAWIARHLLTALGGALVGGVIGFYTTLAIIVARARAGYYIFAIHDLADVRFELLAVLLGIVAGGVLAYRMPRRFLRAVVHGLVGLIAGAVVGALAGALFGQSDEAVWAGGVIVSAAAFLGVTVYLLRASSDRPLAWPDLAAATFVGAVLAAAFIIGFRDPQAVAIPEQEPTPLPAASMVAEVVFVVGDAGATETGSAPLLNALREDVERWSAQLARDSAVSVIYAGDLVYPVGVRDRDHPLFPRDSSRLWNQVELVGGPAARRHGTLGLFLTGNHDWGNLSSSVGLDRVVNLAAQLDLARQTGHAVSLLPAAGDPGPAVRDVHTNIRFVFLDTHWFLRTRTSALRTNFLARLEAALQTAGDRHVIVVSHHPYQSAGPHGAIVPGHHMWGIGYLLKKSGALVQDLNAPVYDELRTGMKRIFAEAPRPPLVYAGGHDHSLQVIERQEEHTGDPSFMLVSGAGSKITSIRTLPNMHYGAGRPGYMMLVFRKDDAVDLFVVAGAPELLSCGTVTGRVKQACMTIGENAFDVVYGRTLAAAPDRPLLAETTPGRPEDDPSAEPARTVANVMEEVPTEPARTAFATAWWTRASIPPEAGLTEDAAPRSVPGTAVPARVLYFQPDTVRATIGASYLPGALHRFVLGDLNRHLWDVPVRLPVLNLDTLGGGVQPEDLTGGMQTVGLRLKGKNGTTYQFRNMVKVAARGLQPGLQQAALEDVLQDQLSAQFPLGAMIVAELLNAVDVLVARPTPVVMPNDERLGPYRPYFAGRVGWIEARPNEQSDDRPGFAGSRKIVGGTTIYERLREDPANRADVRKYLRARMVDFLVGDWDRHADNWRWARFDGPQGHRWEPIPRDRDWAFMRTDGLASYLSRFVFPRYVTFNDQMPPVNRLAEAGYALDHRILSGVPSDVFLAEARYVQETLSDVVLLRAIDILPPEYLALERTRLLRELKARRAMLPKMAATLHGLLEQSVFVYGYDNVADAIHIEPVGATGFRLRAWTQGRENAPYFNQTYDRRRTHEIRLYIDPATDVVTRPSPFSIPVVIVAPGKEDFKRAY